MRPLTIRDRNPRNARVIEQFFANNGVVPSQVAPGAPLLLLHTVGARSGQHRVTPLRYERVNAEVYAVFGSNGGRRRHPDWYFNLLADPDVSIDVGTANGIEKFEVYARILDGAALEQAWEHEKSLWESRRSFDIQSGDRLIPVIHLERRL